MSTIKDSEVWVVQYKHPDFFDCNRVCSTKDIAFASVLADYARMNVSDFPTKLPRWKELKCLWDNEESIMFSFVLEDEKLNLKETIKCFIYKTYIL
jgi:hypothetical protein